MFLSGWGISDLSNGHWSEIMLEQKQNMVLNGSTWPQLPRSPVNVIKPEFNNPDVHLPLGGAVPLLAGGMLYGLRPAFGDPYTHSLRWGEKWVAMARWIVAANMPMNLVGCTWNGRCPANSRNTISNELVF